MKVDELYEGLFDFIKRNHSTPEVKEPPQFPPMNNVDGWMTDMVAFYKARYPDDVWHLFCPSSHDYIPLTLHAVSTKLLQQHMDHYLTLKSQNPEAATTALKNVRDYNVFPKGPREDYPESMRGGW